MAAGSLLALLDDIAAILDDMATMTKVAATKTSGVVADDLAVNAQQIAGSASAREWPIIWEVAKGSFKNKAILVPSALLMSFAAPWAIPWVLAAGGAYLCYEGSEKLIEFSHYLKNKERQSGETPAETPDQTVMKASVGIDRELSEEREKINGAIKTDMVLSGEIIIIALGTVAAAPFLSQLAILSAIGAGMTVLVYGTVAGLVKIDDLGFHLMSKESPAARALGEKLVNSMPFIMKGLTVAGTVFMLNIGGAMIGHAVGIGLGSGVAGFASESAFGILAGFVAIASAGPVGAAVGKVKSLFAKKSEPSEEPNEKSVPRSVEQAPKPGPEPRPFVQGAATPDICTNDSNQDGPCDGKGGIPAFSSAAKSLAAELSERPDDKSRPASRKPPGA